MTSSSPVLRSVEVIRLQSALSSNSLQEDFTAGGGARVMREKWQMTSAVSFDSSSGVATVPAGTHWLTSKKTFQRPIRFSVRARQSDTRNPECLVFQVFSQDRTTRHSGYTFGPGWRGKDFGIHSHTREIANYSDMSHPDPTKWHEYALEALADGTMRVFIDGSIKHTWHDTKLSSGSVGIAPSCREMEIEQIRVEQPKGDQNLALGRPTLQSSTALGGAARRAVDGNREGSFELGSCSHTKKETSSPWWRVDLGESRLIGVIKLQNREDCCGDHLKAFEIMIGDVDGPNESDNAKCSDSGHPMSGDSFYPSGNMPAGSLKSFDCNLRGRYVYVKNSADHPLSLCEVEVYAKDGNLIDAVSSTFIVGSDSVGSWTVSGGTVEAEDAANDSAFNGAYLHATAASSTSNLKIAYPSSVRAGKKYRLSLNYAASSTVSSATLAYSMSLPEASADAPSSITVYFEAYEHSDLIFFISGDAGVSGGDADGTAFLMIDDVELVEVAHINKAHADFSLPDYSSFALTNIEAVDVEGEKSCGSLVLAAQNGQGEFTPVGTVSPGEAMSIRSGVAKTWRLSGVSTEIETCSLSVSMSGRLQDTERDQCQDACSTSRKNFVDGKRDAKLVASCIVGCDIASSGASSRESNKYFDASSCETLPKLWSAYDGTDEDESYEDACMLGISLYSFAKEIACPDGMVIEDVEFASYGTPTGSCETFEKGKCHAEASEEYVRSQCVGKEKCFLSATSAAFGGDPCVGKGKRLAVQVKCAEARSGEGPPAREPFNLVVSATDAGGMKGVAKVIVAVQDVNEPPRIEFPGMPIDNENRVVKENSNTGTQVGVPLVSKDDEKDARHQIRKNYRPVIMRVDCL